MEPSIEQSVPDSNETEFIGVFPAWPYANGPRHIGHGASLLSADVIARYNRGLGNDVLMVSGTDEHGTPNEIAAKKANIETQDYVNRMNDIIRQDFELFGMSFDRFTRTTSPRHAEIAQELFLKLVDNEYLTKDTMLGSYDAETGESLPDRYVEGICPTEDCGEHARGDQCEECGTMLDPSELIDPHSGVSGNPVEFRETEHMFLRLDLLADKVKMWINDHEGLRPNAKNMSLGMINDMPARPVTRDMKWGIPLPEGVSLQDADQKVIYVWFEAVIGYLSASIEWAEEQGDPELWKNWWHNEESTHHYAMGKDNIPFHTIIWPAILMGASENSDHTYTLPGGIASTEYLTMGDGKFSSSKGNVLYLRDMLSVYGQDTMRYYFISAGPETSDKAFSIDELVTKTNTELIANWGNLVNRTLNVASKNITGDDLETIDQISPEESTDSDVLQEIKSGFDEIGDLIEQAKFRAAIDAVMQKSALINKYLFDQEPWKKFKSDEADIKRAKRVMHTAMEAVLNIATLMSPFLPASSTEVRGAFGVSSNLYGEFEHVETEVAGRSSTHLTGNYSESRGAWAYQSLPPSTGYEKPKPLFRKLEVEESSAELNQYISAHSIGSIALEGLNS